LPTKLDLKKITPEMIKEFKQIEEEDDEDIT